VSKDKVRPVLTRRRDIERGNLKDVFARYPQDLAACRENGSSRTQPHDRLRQAGGGVDDVLAIIEDEEELPLSNGPGDSLRENLAARQLQADGPCDGGGNKIGI
jgi:hypothetical protein